MDDVNRDSAPQPAAHGRKPYPRFMVVAAVERAATDGAVAGLGDAGFARDRIEVTTAEDVHELGEPVGGTGLRGFLTRLGLSLGADLDEVESAQRELAAGHALVMVQVHGDAEQDRAHDVLRRHGGHAMRYFGRWTVTMLEGDDQR